MSADTPSRVSPSATRTTDPRPLYYARTHNLADMDIADLPRVCKATVEALQIGHWRRLLAIFGDHLPTCHFRGVPSGVERDECDCGFGLALELAVDPPRFIPNPETGIEATMRFMEVYSPTPEERAEIRETLLASRGTEPEDFEEMLREHAQIAYRNGAAAMNSSKSITDITPIEQAIRGYVSRFQSERAERHRCYLEAPEELKSSEREVDSLRSQLARIQQTGLTARQAWAILHIEDDVPDEFLDDYSEALAKLKSLAALRSLGGEGK